MVFSDIMRALAEAGFDVTEAKVRWALKSRYVARPPLDGSHRYDFSEQHLASLKEYFEQRRAAAGNQT